MTAITENTVIIPGNAAVLVHASTLAAVTMTAATERHAVIPEQSMLNAPKKKAK